MERKHKYWGFIDRYAFPLISFGKNEKAARREFKRLFGEKPTSFIRMY